MYIVGSARPGADTGCIRLTDSAGSGNLKFIFFIRHKKRGPVGRRMVIRTLRMCDKMRTTVTVHAPSKGVYCNNHINSAGRRRCFSCMGKSLYYNEKMRIGTVKLTGPQECNYRSDAIIEVM